MKNFNYRKTNWVNNNTRIDAEKLNNIENGIKTISDSAIESVDIVGDSGINVGYSKSGGVRLSLIFRKVDEAPDNEQSLGNAGDYYIDAENGYIYFCLGINNPIEEEKNWIKLKLYQFEEN